MSNKGRLFYLIAISIVSNIVNVSILTLSNKRGGDVTVQLKYTGWMIVIWIISFSLAVLVPNPIDEATAKSYGLLRALVILFCTPIPFMVGCTVFN